MPSNNLRIVVSNTGPLISVFQSNTDELLYQLFDQIRIPETVFSELVAHGTAARIQQLQSNGLIFVVSLDERERHIALEISNQIAASSHARAKNADTHYAEAEAIVLAERVDSGVMEILLDERAAYPVALSRQLPVTGFAGILVRACQRQLMSVEAARNALLSCQSQGTHYSNEFIAQVYDRLTKGPI